MARRPTSAAVLLALAALTGGCGGGGSLPADQRAIRTAGEHYLRALAGGDYAGACGQMTAPAQSRIVRRVARLRIPAATCASALAALVMAIPEPQRTQVLDTSKGATVGQIRVTGGTATGQVTATFRGQSRGYRIGFTREGGTWKVDARTSPTEG